MRSSTWAFWAMASVCTAGTIAACGSTITTIGGAGATGATAAATSGAGGTMKSSVVATSSSSAGQGGAVVVGVSATASASASGSGGGGGAGGANVCTEACAHLQSCGGMVTCAGIEAVAKITFDCSDQAQQCFGMCLNGAACGNGLYTETIGCAQTCGLFGGAAASTGATAGSTGSGGVQQCGACAMKSCLGGIFGSCFGNPACQAWGFCAFGCFQGGTIDAACLQSCDAKNPGAASSYEPVYQCLCNTCGTECAAADPCSLVTGVGEGGVDEGGILSDGGIIFDASAGG